MTSLLRRAFPEADLDGLDEAVVAVLAARPSPAVPALIAQIAVGGWSTTRSVVAGLRGLGDAARAAIPEVAGWVACSASAAADAEEQHTVLEALLALQAWRESVGERRGLPDQAAERFLQVLAQTLDPFLVTALVPPLRVWHRGAVGYLSTTRMDPERLIEALTRLLAGTDEPAPTGYGAWHAQTRAEIVRLVAETGRRLEAEREAQAFAGAVGTLTEPTRTEPNRTEPTRTEPTRTEAAERGPQIDDPVVAWAVAELGRRELRRCAAAVEIVARLGPRAAPALPALHALLLIRPDDPPPALLDLQRAAAEAAVMIVGRLPPPPHESADHAGLRDATFAEAVAGEAFTSICRSAAEDPEVSVRVEALDLLARLARRDGVVLGIAVNAVRADDPAERRAALRLLAALDAGGARR